MSEKKLTKKECQRLNKISEYEAQIGLNEMIIDYYKDTHFAKCLQWQIDHWKEKIKKLNGTVAD